MGQNSIQLKYFTCLCVCNREKRREGRMRRIIYGDMIIIFHVLLISHEDTMSFQLHPVNDLEMTSHQALHIAINTTATTEIINNKDATINYACRNTYTTIQ